MSSCSFKGGEYGLFMAQHVLLFFPVRAPGSLLSMGRL